MALIPTPANPGPFGHAQRKNFLFPETYTQFNHGSYGTFPRVVQKSMFDWHNHTEEDPDRFVRVELRPALRKTCESLGKFLNCDGDDLVLVQNTTAGVNTVMRSLDFQPGDRILCLSTTYVSVDSCIRYLCNTHQDLKSICIPVEYPIKDHELVQLVEKAIEDHKALNDGSRIRIAVVDWISSVPAVVHPIKPLVDLLKSHDILTLIDGAHTIGQVPVDLSYIGADFFITNCHKWLYSVRGSAVLYVAKPYQTQVHPIAIPVDYGKGFEIEFAWLGTQDYSSMLSIEAALKFREQYGEEAIIGYCHALALEGGAVMAKILGTNTLTGDDDHQVANMINVRLPVKNLNDPRLDTPQYLMDKLMKEYNIFAPSFKHGGHYWTRVSSQIYLELSDLEKLGQIWKTVIDELNADQA